MTKHENDVEEAMHTLHVMIDLATHAVSSLLSSVAHGLREVCRNVFSRECAEHIAEFVNTLYSKLAVPDDVKRDIVMHVIIHMFSTSGKTVKSTIIGLRKAMKRATI